MTGSESLDALIALTCFFLVIASFLGFLARKDGYMLKKIFMVFIFFIFNFCCILIPFYFMESNKVQKEISYTKMTTGSAALDASIYCLYVAFLVAAVLCWKDSGYKMGQFLHNARIGRPIFRLVLLLFWVALILIPFYLINNGSIHQEETVNKSNS